ncbi:lipase [Mycobacterium sp. M1]|uniref:Lipase n=1 Tax=Mycolicibacter acidiphilus TaxID=2835306 RepID=A0ABS5RK17_9MYCO|nr:lipase family protein [Mycolicibacter acidiphilus]MBS9534590.1 lipase [Mycolicibacter acidiphilus]
MLRSREVRLAFLGVVDQPVTAYQLLYRTTDMHGAPQATLTTVILPGGDAPRGPRPVVSYQCAIDAVASEAFPSYVLRRQAKVWGGFPPLEFPLMACALDNGWAVIVPDHEGPRGSWVAPREPGYCVLDGIRAAANFAPSGISAQSPVALWGYSGGGLASAWAAELWADYAPELNVVGAVLGSPVGNPGEALRDLNGSAFAGLAAMGLAALTREHSGLRRVVQAHVDLAGKSLLAGMQTATTIGALARLFRHRVDRYFDEPLDEILASPAVVELFDEIRLGHAAPGMPLLVLQAAGDQIIDVRHIDALVANYREMGAQVTYLRDQLSEHFLLHPLSVPVVLKWISERFANQSVRPPRTSRGLLVLSPQTLVGLARVGGIAVRVALGRLGRRVS